MKRKLLTGLFIYLMASGLSAAFGQDPSEGVTTMGDTLVIKPTFNGNPLNALNQWILWDHDGDLANTPNHTVYMLLRNSDYPITTTVRVNGRTHLVAKKPDLDNKPPQVAVTDDINGNEPRTMFIGGPFTFRNIWFSHLNYATQQNNTWGMMVNLQADSTSNYIDGCYMEHIRAMFMKATSGKGNKIYFTNNFLNDNGNGGVSIFQGHFFNSEDHTQDSLVFRNNTFINTPGIFLNVRKNMTRYVEISNNTLINTTGYPFFTAWYIEAVVKNNLMWNVFSGGESEEMRNQQEPDQLAYSMINIDTLANEFTMTDPSWLDREPERSLQVSHNYYGWRDDIEALWATSDVFFAPQWMNSRTLAMFADDVNYPLLTEENTYTKSDLGVPDFESPIQGTDEMITWITDAWWSDDPTPGIRFVWEPEGAVIPNMNIDWPPLEDLRLKNRSTFVGDDGKPLGDLNWYPEYAERWDMTGWGRDTEDYTSVERLNDSGIQLRSYPNPFVNETNIVFNLETSSNVRIFVYDITGKNVAMLFEGTQHAGQHSIKWDGRSSSGHNLSKGLYFLQVQTETGVMTHKLLKK